MIEVENLSTSLALHNQGSAVVAVLEGAGFRVSPGECVALTGASGAGKSTVLRIPCGNGLAQAGRVSLGGADLAQATPRDILAPRRERPGCVRQFLRVGSRVPRLEVVAEPLLALGVSDDAAFARARARDLLGRQRIPERLWSPSPTTFSGGEQQRVNLARGFAHRCPALLRDEPTASLDATNRETVLTPIGEAQAAGAASVGIFRDAEARRRVADREVDVRRFAAVAA